MTCYNGSPDVDFAKAAAAFGVEGEIVNEPDKIKAALDRAKRANVEGRPYLLDIHVDRDGVGAGIGLAPGNIRSPNNARGRSDNDPHSLRGALAAAVLALVAVPAPQQQGRQSRCRRAPAARSSRSPAPSAMRPTPSPQLREECRRLALPGL